MKIHSSTPPQGAEDIVEARRLARSIAAKHARYLKSEAYRQGLVLEATRKRSLVSERLEAMEGIRAKFTRGMSNAQTIALDQVIEGIRDEIKAIDTLFFIGPVANA